VASKRKKLRLGAIHLRLTRAGWVFLLVSVLFGVASVRNQEAPLMFVMFGMMMGALMISITLSGRALAGIRVIRSMPSRTWQGEVVNLGYYVDNTRKRGACMGLTLGEMPPEGVETVGGYCMHIRARTKFRAAGRLTPRRRGRITLNSISLSTTFPFGLVRADRKVTQTTSIVVWPARGRLKQRLLHRGAVETSSAPPSQASGGSDEFFGLREYRPGDNPRWIHWRRSATRRAPVVREMARPLPETLWVLVDARATEQSTQDPALCERVLRLAATLIDHAFIRSYHVGLGLADTDGPRLWAPASGRGQRNDLLDALSDADANTPVAIEEVLARMDPRALRQAQVVVVTPRPDVSPGALAGLRRACKHLTVVASNRLDRVFEDLPPVEAPPCP